MSAVLLELFWVIDGTVFMYCLFTLVYYAIAVWQSFC